MNKRGKQGLAVAIWLTGAVGTAVAGEAMRVAELCAAPVAVQQGVGYSTGADDYRGLPTYPWPGEWPTCDVAVHTADKYVGAGMERMNHWFREWQPAETTRGDLCLSGKLSECYPGRGTLIP